MTSEARAELRRALGDDLEALDRMPDEDLARLLAVYRRAHARQEKALVEAEEKVLRFLPGPLRRKVVQALGKRR